jgi:hypothetical protein
MTITLPKKLESRINQLFPKKKEREAFLSNNIEGLVNMMTLLEAQDRDPRSLRVLEKARAKAEHLQEKGITRDDAYDQLRRKIKKLGL